MILTVNPDHPSPYKIQQIIDLLNQGAVIALPTDTCYALACLPNHRSAVEQLIQLRKLNKKKPRALVFSSIKQVSQYTLLSDVNYRLLKRFLPGPYCFVLESNRKLPRFIGDKRQHIGVRIPNHPVLLSLIEELQTPLTVTSAIDPDGEIMLYDPWTIADTFGPNLAMVVDAGVIPSEVSSVIDLTGDEVEILREGLGDVSPFR